MKKKIHFAWVIVVLLCLVMAGTYGLAVNSIGVLFNAVIDDLHFTKGEMGLYYTIRGLAASVAIVWTVALFQKRKGNVWLAVYCLTLSLSVGMMASFSHLWQWYVSAALAGIGSSGIYTIVPIVINNWFNRYRGTILGITFASSGFFGILFNPTVSTVIENIGWRNASLVIAAAGLLLTVPASLAIRRSPEELSLSPYGEPETDRKELRLSDDSPAVPNIVFMMLVSFILLDSISMSFNNILSFFGQSLGYGLTASALLTSFAMIGNLAGKIGSGILSDHIGPFRTSYIISGSILAAAVLFLLCQSSQTIIYLASLLYGFTYAAMAIRAPLLLKIYGQKNYKSVLVKLTTISGFANALFSSAASFLYDYFGSFNSALILIVFACFMQLVLMKGVHYQTEKSQNTAEQSDIVLPC